MDQRILDQDKVTGKSTKEISVTHITIRQSISILLLKLILIEFLAALGVILFHSFFTQQALIDISSINATVNLFNVPLFLTIVAAKIFLMIFVVMQWVEEQYEITTKELIHRTGFIFRKEESYNLEHLGSIELQQNFLGKVLNYGTVQIYNWATEKEVSLYLIHNPVKYYSILKILVPEADRGKKVVREHVLEPEEN